MEKVTSKDGTQIAYDRQGTGPALLLVDGALCYRSFGPMQGLAQLLAPYFTVYYYDRRGRGDSGDTKPYAVEREVEDIEALIEVGMEMGCKSFAHAGLDKEFDGEQGSICVAPGFGEHHFLVCHRVLKCFT